MGARAPISFEESARELVVIIHVCAKLQLRSNPERKAAYLQAIKDRVDRLAEELMELADTPLLEDLTARADLNGDIRCPVDSLILFAGYSGGGNKKSA